MDKTNLTLGSLFDGSGGFPLAGLLSGITPVWASEIEPFPILVTQKRLPFVKHYGDVSTLDGGKLEPVEIITFGSPCQDMSIAGKRDGLEGSRSCLFYEAIRIVKEMRCATDGEYPKYIVWENVPGAFSGGKGEDFRSVLEAVCSVKDNKADIPRYERWPSAGEIVARDYSVAWRVLDAQYWGGLACRLGRRFCTCGAKVSTGHPRPRDAAESILSRILQADVPEKYYLSPKACQGILRRASARGKELPEVLRLALERQASCA